MFSYTLSRSRKHTNAKPSSEFKLPRGNLILRDGTTTNQSRAARRRGKLNDIYKVYIIISEILMILVQISLRNGLRSALTLSKLKNISGGACPQTPLVGAASPLRCLRQRYSVYTPFSKYLATPLILAMLWRQNYGWYTLFYCSVAYKFPYVLCNAPIPDHMTYYTCSHD